ncbi:hypothetical protein N0V88_006209 [Collariella sp. IMI 366227]|nr:hypothetical protein N0V88_006209 [Collariella sp. IMI 366227]
MSVETSGYVPATEKVLPLPSPYSTTTTSSEEGEEEEDHLPDDHDYHHDGHRPSLLDIHRTRILSHLRSRPSAYPTRFAHPSLTSPPPPTASSTSTAPRTRPIVSTVLAEQPSLGWRWTEYLAGILQCSILLLAVIFIDETYPPKLLVYKARRLRVESGNWALHARFEEWDVSVGELARKFLIRPVQLLCTPICFLVALYASFCYGILYMQLGSIPIIFGEIRGWSPIVATLPFLCIFIGAILGCAANVYNQLLYNKAYHAAGNRAVPERRLPPMMIGSVLFAGGQFLTGWTAGPNIHWIVPCIGLVLLGTGFFTIFQAALNYLVDTFTTNQPKFRKKWIAAKK